MYKYPTMCYAMADRKLRTAYAYVELTVNMYLICSMCTYMFVMVRSYLVTWTFMCLGCVCIT